MRVEDQFGFKDGGSSVTTQALATDVYFNAPDLDLILCKNPLFDICVLFQCLSNTLTQQKAEAKPARQFGHAMQI